MVRDSAITADDVRSGNAQFVAYNVSGDGNSQASGNAPVALVLPYDNMVPVSGTLHVMNTIGAEVATLNIEAAEDNVLTGGMDSTISLPGGWNGYTKVLLAPKDINTGSAFTPVAGENYTYTLDAQFAQTTDPNATDGAPILNVSIDFFTPYPGSVTETGFATEGYSLSSASYMNGAQGTVLFPSDGSASYATVTADGQSMAMVSVDSGNTGVTAGSGDGLKLMVWEPLSIIPSRCRQGIMELIVRVVHLIDAKYLLETSLVKSAVVGYERKSLDERTGFFPDIRENGSVLRILRSQAMDSPAEPLVIIRFGMDQAVESVRDPSVTYDDDPDAADAARAFVRCLEIYRRKISHKP